MTTLARRRRDPRRPVWQEQPSAAGQGAKVGTIAVILLLVLLPMYSIVLTSYSTQSSCWCRTG
jgi:multiple sugar transport system permease protein/putative aldouronate transport system permease protein